MSDDPRPKGRQAQRAQTRQRLLDAALTEFGTHGFGGARVDRIVGSVGMTRGAFYGHFDSLGDLALELLEMERQLEVPELIDLVGQVETVESLMMSLNERSRVRQEKGNPLNVAFIGELLMVARHESDVRERLREVYQLRMTTIANVISTLVENSGLVLTDTPQRLAHILMALELGLSMPATILNDDDDLPRFVDEIMPTFFLRGAAKLPD